LTVRRAAVSKGAAIPDAVLLQQATRLSIATRARPKTEIRLGNLEEKVFGQARR
jgi:hypothetical protein